MALGHAQGAFTKSSSMEPQAVIKRYYGSHRVGLQRFDLGEIDHLVTYDGIRHRSPAILVKKLCVLPVRQKLRPS
jgi:hypothetical protein